IPCLVLAAEASEQVSPDGVVGVVWLELEILDRLEGGGRACDLGQRDRAIERHYRCRRPREQLVIEGKDLCPFRLLGARGVGVDGIDRGLNLVRAGLIAAQARAYEVMALGDQPLIPERPVLI